MYIGIVAVVLGLSGVVMYIIETFGWLDMFLEWIQGKEFLALIFHAYPVLLRHGPLWKLHLDGLFCNPRNPFRHGLHSFTLKYDDSLRIRMRTFSPARF